MFTAEQQRIYNGLKNIGQSLANFYEDGVRMISPDCTLLSKANMIAHAAREIDGGLRDVFAPDKIAKGKKSEITDIEKGNSDYFASILAAVGKDDANNALANKWFDIARNFHRIAHRKNIHGATSVDPTEITNLWAEYEKILTTVIGSFLSITNRLDVILKLDEPQSTALPSLRNVLTNPQHANYFFSRLDKTMWLKPLMDEGYFDSDNAPVKTEGNVIPDQWQPIKYLVNISHVARRNVKDNLLKVIDRIMAAYTSGEIELHPYTITEILQLIINIDDLSFTKSMKRFIEKYDSLDKGYGWNLTHSTMAEGLAGKLVKKRDIDGLKNLLDYFFGFTTYEEPAISFFGEETKPYIQKKPNVEDHFISELLTKHGNVIISQVGPDSIRIAMQKITDLVKLGSHGLTGGSPASIEPTDQSVYGHGWEDILVYFIRDFAPQLQLADLEKVIDEMFDSKVQILQRLAIHLTRTHFEQFSDRWWKFIKNYDGESSVYIHEPYVLLREHSSKFTDEEFETTIAWIEKMNPGDVGEDKELSRQFAGYRIRRWLTALNPASDKSRLLKKEKEEFYLSWNKAKMIDHPEFDSYGTSSIGYDYPMNFSDFKRMSAKEQIDYIKAFVPDHAHDSSEQGLGEMLKAGVFEEPMKYLYMIDDFIPLHSLYVNDLVAGFTEALKKDKITDFSLVLGFIETKLSDKHFREEEQKAFLFKKWFASSVSEYVSAVVAKHEQLQLTKDDFERMINLLLSMIDTTEFQDDSEEIRNGYLNHVLNSVPGRLYLALVELTRVWADKFVEKDEPIKWPDAVRAHFTRLLASRENKEKDFSIILGMELPLVLYLDRQWVEDNLNIILDKKNEPHYDYRMHTIFSRHYRPSADFYHFLKSHRIFNNALEYFASESASLDTIMVYALLEWKFWKGDPEKDSIIAEIFSIRSPEQVKRLVHSAWEQQLLNPDELIYLIERLSPLFDELPELADHHSILLWLFERLPELNQKTFDLATSVIAKTKEGRETYSFLRHLYGIADSNIELAGKLVLQVYQAKLATPYREHDLKDLVKKLYAAGFKDVADGICVEVGEMGSLALKDLYNQNN